MYLKNPKVDEYFYTITKWKEELELIRTIVLDCLLVEELKWGQPCYTFNKKNVLILGGFKDFCVLSFIKGSLIHDTENILEKPGENTQAVRWIKFTSTKQILALKSILTTYIIQAIEVEKAGIKIEQPDNTKLELAEELITIFKKNKAFKKAFEALTPGRQRAYNMFFTASKQSSTRIARIEKYQARIMNGKGINDCTCGLSKKMPNCDGSHKYLKND